MIHYSTERERQSQVAYELRVDYSLPLRAEPHIGHNRWHPAIPPALRCNPGDELVLDTRDAVDGQFTTESTDEHVLGIDRTVVHPLTGPVYVTGAEPGDLLVVDILEISPPSFGYTAQIPGLGFLRDLFPDPFIVTWHIADGWAVSNRLPGVRIPAAPFIGTIGVAPSADLLSLITAREQRILDQGGFVNPPTKAGAVPADEVIAREGLRTMPPRENGGNLDVKQLGPGARVLLPVFAKGALLSVGDVHFAQGDSEICGTAIEIRSTVRLRVDIKKLEGERSERPRVRFQVSGGQDRSIRGYQRNFYATTGISVDPGGANSPEDLGLAARNALIDMIDYLVRSRGYNRQQAYAICSVAVDLRISAVVNVPNFLVSAFLPLDIFVQQAGVGRGTLRP